MKPCDGKNYIREATRTEAHPKNIESALKSNYRRIHSLLGILSEAGEIADALKRHIFYGQPLNFTNVVEEVGDFLWYLAIMLDSCGVKDITKCMEANIEKLRSRYPDKFTEYDALEGNRNRDKEAVVIERHLSAEETDKEEEATTLFYDSGVLSWKPIQSQQQKRSPEVEKP